MIGGLTAIAAALKIQNDMFVSQVISSNQILSKTKETFSILPTADSTTNNRLSVTVKNLGSTPVQIADVWIINNTSPNYKQILINTTYADAFVAPLHLADVLKSQTIKLDPGAYTIKVVSTQGTVQKTGLSVYALGSKAPTIPDVKFFATNRAATSGDDVAFTMYIQNNGIDDLTNVNATIPTITPSAMGASSVVSFIPQRNVTLPAGATTVFIWHANMTGAVGQKGTISSTITAKNSTGATITVAATTQVTISQLAVATRGAPIMSLILPGPMGNTVNSALYGVTLSNTLDTTVTVTQVTINVFSPGLPQNTNLFGSTITSVAGSPGSGTWTSAVGTLQWLGSETIPAKSGMSFLVKAAGAAKLGANLPTVLVSANAFTNIGEFAKTGYSTGINNGATPAVDTYLAKNPASVATTDFLGNLTNVASGSTVKYNMTLANLDPAGGTNTIKAGATLSIFIPSGFTSPTVTSSTGFNTPTVTTFADGSTIIAATTTSDTAANTAVSIQFTAVSPTVSKTFNYIFGSSASGSTSDSTQNISAIAEIPVQVLHS